MRIIFCFFASFLVVSTITVNSAQAVQTIKFAGQWPFHPTKAIAVDIDRNLVFLGDGERLCILDDQLKLISNFPVSKADIAGIYYAVEDRRIYVAARSEGLRIIAVSDDSSDPVEIGAYHPGISGAEVYGVYVVGHIAYLSCGLSGVLVVDVSNPNEPALMGEPIDLPGAWGITFAVDVFISGDYAFVADIYNGLHVIKISDPGSPEYKKMIALPGARDLFVSDGYLYTALEGGGLVIIDMTNPEDPKEAVTYQVEGAQERAVRVDGNHAYVGYNLHGLRVLDISDKTALVHDPSWEYTATGAKSIALDTKNKFAYITDDRVGLQKIRIDDPAAMARTAQFDTPGDANAIEISGNFAYVLDDSVGDDQGGEGLRIFQITSSNQVILLKLTGFMATPGHANDISIIGDLACVADGENGLRIIDIKDKTSPSLLGSIPTPGTAKGVFAHNGYAYLADGDQGLAVIDISDPSNPQISGSFDTPGDARDVFVSGGYAFIADGETGIIIVDVTNPAAPTKIATLDTPGSAQGILVEGDYAYVADGDQGLSVISIVDKSAPLATGSLDTPGFANQVRISGNFAYVADGTNGVVTIDVSDQAAPLKVDGWSFDTYGTAMDIFSGFSVDDAMFVFVADGPSGVVVLNPTIEKDYNDDENSGSGGGGCFINAL